MNITNGSGRKGYKGQAGENLAKYDACYLNADEKWYKAVAGAVATMPVVAMSLQAIASDSSGTLLLFGLTRNTAWAWTIGGIIYASCTAGEVTQVAPSTTGNQVQVLGIAIEGSLILFNPSYELVERA